MHIVFLTHGFPVKELLYTSGAGNYVANMARTLVGFGHKVTVVVEGEVADNFVWKGIQVHKIRATRGFRNTGRPMPVYKKLAKNLWRSLWYNKEVAIINKKDAIDIVQCVNSYGISLLRNKKIPYVIRISDYPALWSGANKEKYDFDACIHSRRIDEEIQFIALKRADVLVAPSTLMKNLVEDKISKVVNVVEGPVFLGDENIEQFSEQNLISNKYMLTYGAMTYRKEIHILVQIIEKILDKYSDMSYVMVGKDKEIFYQGEFMLVSDLFKRTIIRNKERFFFMGEIADRKRLLTLVKHAYACILPTRIDNLPNTCMEAMSLGKIVISTNGTSVEQLITDGYNGYLAEIDNGEDLYHKIRNVLELSKEQKESFEKRAKERTNNLTPENVYKQMMDLYCNTITQN